MRRLIPAATLLALPAVAPAAANAEWYFSKAGAQSVARDAAHKRYGIEWDTSIVTGRPQYVPYEPGYKYHRWVCRWAGTDPDFEYVQSGVLAHHRLPRSRRLLRPGTRGRTHASAPVRPGTGIPLAAGAMLRRCE